MKRIIPFSLVVVLVCLPAAWGQHTMYDYSYQGPRNYYGQPQYEPVPRPGQAQPGARQGQPGGWQGQAPGQYGPYGQRQGQWAPNGFVPQAMNAVQRVGGYFWSYMPAPLRGAPNPNVLQPSPEGSVSVINVPGNP